LIDSFSSNGEHTETAPDSAPTDRPVTHVAAGPDQVQTHRLPTVALLTATHHISPPATRVARRIGRATVADSAVSPHDRPRNRQYTIVKDAHIAHQNQRGRTFRAEIRHGSTFPADSRQDAKAL
jgi:hypothetical protein